MFLPLPRLLLISLLLLSVTQAHKCTHDQQSKPEPLFLDAQEEGFPPSQDRLLASTTPTYNNIRMKPYYGLLANFASEYQSYVANSLIPPILSYFQATLKVKYPTTAPIKFSSSMKTVCNSPTPAELHTGVNTDFYYIVDLTTDPSTTWVANSFACYLTTGSKRPYVGKTTINTNLMSPANDDVLRHEKNMICIMHELTHTLGFSSQLYQFFVDSNGNRLNGHFTTETVNGVKSNILNVEPLTTRLRNHFGCSTLKGAYMENNGGSGTDGSHFERRQFGFEAMTSGLIYEMQFSEFTLALLEGSGWYVANYNNADAFFWGQGQGCDFLLQSCSSSGFSFAEMCKNTKDRGCAVPGRGGAYCSSDAKSDGCKFYHPNVNYDCENADAADYARLPNLQVFGRGLGSKCFTGNLTTSKSASSVSFCFKYTCSGSGSSTTLSVKVGDNTVACSKAGTASVPGYKGVINCPDPLDFCSTVGKKVCPRGCMGQGTCVNGVCQCNAGYSGTDCALNA